MTETIKEQMRIYKEMLSDRLEQLLKKLNTEASLLGDFPHAPGPGEKLGQSRISQILGINQSDVAALMSGNKAKAHKFSLEKLLCIFIKFEFDVLIDMNVGDGDFMYNNPISKEEFKQELPGGRK